MDVYLRWTSEITILEHASLSESKFAQIRFYHSEKNIFFLYCSSYFKAVFPSTLLHQPYCLKTCGVFSFTCELKFQLSVFIILNLF